MSNEFEIGPIRPPSEAESLLLRITRNCPWNKCRFCKLYKSHSFAARPVAEIKADIDRVAQIREDILDWSSVNEESGNELIRKKLNSLSTESQQCYLHVLQWMSAGRKSVFLQDANAMVLSFDKLREILAYLREKLPLTTRITSYGRVDSLNKFTVGQLAELRDAGLDRIHSGYESGSDKVLALLNKGYSKAQEIEAGRKVKEAGIELSIYYMPGAGGRGLSDENAHETADVVNKVNPDFVRVRTFVTLPGTELFDDFGDGSLNECSDKEKMLELKKMIGHIECAGGHLYSDHIINLFEDVNGNMGADKEKMLSVFAAFEELDATEQHKYQIARRMGMVRSLSDYKSLGNPQTERLNELLAQLGAEQEFEAFLTRLLRRYI